MSDDYTEFDVQKWWNKKKKDGFYIGKSWDIRKVEEIFRKLFGKKKKKKKGEKEKYDERRESENR